MADRKLGIAIIGAGAVAPAHVTAYLDSSDLCEIKTICNPTVSKAQQLIDDNKLDAKAVPDFEDVLRDPEIDAVSICVPPALHAEFTVKALNAGKHVLCEKPMAGSLEECDAMIRAAEESGRVLASVAQNRYKTPYWKMKQLLDAGALGPLQFATVNSLWWRGESYYDIYWRGTWEKETGGCFLSHAVHHIDLLLWMFGMPKSVTAVVSNVGHHNSECEDMGICVLRYDKMIVQLTASIVTHNEAQEILVQGEKAGISVPWGVWANKALPNGFPEENPEEAERVQKMYDALPNLEREGHSAQIRNFLKAINGDEELLIDGVQGRNTIELISAIYESSCEGREVSLPIGDDDDFYFKGGTAKRMPHFFEKTISIEKFENTRPITYGRDVGK